MLTTARSYISLIASKINYLKLRVASINEAHDASGTERNVLNDVNQRGKQRPLPVECNV